MRLIASFDDISLSFFGCLQGLTRNNIHHEQADEVVGGLGGILVVVVANMSLWLMSLSITSSYTYFGVEDRMSDGSFGET